MRFTFLLFTFLIFFANISLAQTYTKKDLNTIITNIDNDTLTKEVIKDSVIKGELYLKYTLTGFFKNDSIIKIDLILDNKLDIIEESYYLDKGKLIYFLNKEYKYSIALSMFEVIFYNVNNPTFLMDGTPAHFYKDEKNIIINIIEKDLKFYKEHFKK